MNSSHANHLNYEQIVSILLDLHCKSALLLNTDDALLLGPFEQLHGRIDSLLQSLATDLTTLTKMDFQNKVVNLRTQP
jgi:hypothetical protein